MLKKGQKYAILSQAYSHESSFVCLEGLISVYKQPLLIFALNRA